MDRALMDAGNREARDRLLPIRIALARATQVLGWPGWAGLALMAGAASIWVLGWSQHVEVPDTSITQPPIELRAVPVDPSPSSSLALPMRADIPLLLTQIQQIAVTHGLAWNAADYKLVAATDNAPAALEVRCSLKAPYPQLRSTLAQLLRDVPGLAIRDLSMSRLNSDLVDVDAKLVFVVFLQDSAAIGAAMAAGKP